MTQREIDYKAKNILRDRKISAELALEKFKSGIFTRSPEFKELYFTRKQLYCKIGEAISKKEELEISKTKLGATDDFGIGTGCVSELETRLAVVNNDMINILKRLKISSKQLVPNYFCKKCCDTGVFENKPCSCYKRIVEKLLNGEQSRTKHFLFDDFNENFFGENSRRWYKALYNKCEKIANNYPYAEEKLLLFAGFAGTGKTHLAETIATEITSRGFFCQSISAFSLIDVFKSYHFNARDEWCAAKFNQSISCDLLVIDDLGTEPMLNNITKEYLFNVLNERISGNKLTIITSNLTATQLKDKYGERISSRIFATSNLKVEFAGDDLRMK